MPRRRCSLAPRSLWSSNSDQLDFTQVRRSDLGEVEGNVQVVVAVDGILFGVEDFEEGAGRVAAEIAAQATKITGLRLPDRGRMPMRSSALSSRLWEVCRVYAPAVQSVLRQALERWLPSPGQETKIAVGILRTRLSLFCVVRGTYNTSARGGLGSWRDTITTGRVFAASPRSANQTSPGCGLIEQVENLLFRRARAHQIENVLVGQVNDLCYALSYVSRRFRLPLAPAWRPAFPPIHPRRHPPSD